MVAPIMRGASDIAESPVRHARAGEIRVRVLPISPIEGKGLYACFGIPSVYWMEGETVKFWPWPIVTFELEPDDDPYIWIDPFEGRG